MDQTPKCGCRTHHDPDAVGTWMCDVHGLVEYHRMDEAARAAHWKMVAEVPK